jgi:hypothetical protein
MLSSSGDVRLSLLLLVLGGEGKIGGCGGEGSQAGLPNYEMMLY